MIVVVSAAHHSAVLISRIKICSSKALFSIETHYLYEKQQLKWNATALVERYV
jgi:hypothetical protein